MASMGDMPNVARNIMSFCLCHSLSAIRAFLASKNALLAGFRGSTQHYSSHYQGLAAARPPRNALKTV